MEETTKEVQKETQLTPADHLRTKFTNAPSVARIEEWKSHVPGGRVSLQLMPPEGKVGFILRGLSGFEMAQIQKALPQNAENPQYEMEVAAVAAATLWTSLTPDGKLDDLTLRKGPAGLPQTLFIKVSELSCFLTPEQIDLYSGDL